MKAVTGKTRSGNHGMRWVDSVSDAVGSGGLGGNDVLNLSLLKPIMRCRLLGSRGRQRSFHLFTGVILILSILMSSGLVGCRGPSTEELAAVDYTPLPGGDWQVSTPEEQGLDPMLVAELYYNAEQLETLYGMLVVKNGYPVAEKYFQGKSMGQLSSRASETKSITSALVGIALEQGCLTSVDQMMEFFPELIDQIEDPRKEEITIGHLLEMRAGYPWEESTPELSSWRTMPMSERWKRSEIAPRRSCLMSRGTVKGATQKKD